MSAAESQAQQQQRPKLTAAEMDGGEELLREVKNRFVMFPIKYKAIWDMYKKAESAFWTAEEIDLSKDMDDWERLTANERHFVKHVLAFFAGSDGIVNENLSARFMNEVASPEAKAFYGFQIAMENIHCVAPDTQVLTDGGYVTIGSVEGKVLRVWNGSEYSGVMVMKTSAGEPVTSVVLSNGMQLTCTPAHEWLVADPAAAAAGGAGVRRVRTADLQPGAALAPFVYPCDLLELRDQEIFTGPRQHGWLTCRPAAEYSPPKFNCRPQLFVPVNYSVRTKAAWLNGVFQHLLLIHEAADPEAVAGAMLQHPDVDFLRQLQLLLTTMLVDCKVLLELPGPALQLLLTPESVGRLLDLEEEQGVRLELPAPLRAAYARRWEAQPARGWAPGPLTVKAVTELPAPSATFCFEEPLNHTAVFNGVLTGQSETYSLLIDTYIKDGAEKAHLLDAINTIPCIKRKAEWAMRWISDREAPFAMRLVAFAVVEGLFFSGAFCAIFWLKERGLLPGLCTSNEFISRDESLHTEFAVLLYSMIKQRLPEREVHDLVAGAVAIEDEFITQSIPCAMLGMNSGLMSQYIKFVADRLLAQLGYAKLYGAANPFAFMERISLSQKTNFFEHTRVSEYAKAGVGAGADQQRFALDGDF